MGPLQQLGSLQFCIDTLQIKDGHRLGRIRPDENGYYMMPLAVLGIVSQNNTYYDVPAFVEQITGKDAFVRKMLEDGKLYGEFGHPWIAALPRELIIPRLVHIDEKCVSHHIKTMETGKQLENGGVILQGLVRPHGPYGATLKDNLDAPTMNTAFSLRSVTSEQEINGVKHRTMRRFVTCDAVLAGGYYQAAKRFSSAAMENLQYAPGSTRFKHALEGFSVALDRAGSLYFEQVALESITDSELNDLFGAKRILRRGQTLTYLPHGGALLKGGADKRQLGSLFHDVISRRF